MRILWPVLLLIAAAALLATLGLAIKRDPHAWPSRIVAPSPLELVPKPIPASSTGQVPAVPRDRTLPGPLDLEPAFARALDLSNQATFTERSRALSERGRSPLSTEQFDSLLAWLDQTGSTLSPQQLEVRRAIVSEVMELLRETAQTEAEQKRLALKLRQIAETGSDPFGRNYAIQHLGLLIQQGPELTIGPIANDALWTQVLNRDPSLAATALVAIHRSSDRENRGAIPLIEACVKFAADDHSASMVRVAALQILAERKVPEALSSARKLAMHSPDRLLRTAALNAVGHLGDETDLVRLLSFEIYDSGIKVAAESAANRIANRK